MTSSAYMQSLERVDANGYPDMSGCCLIAVARGSKARPNNKGERGHP